MKLNPNSTQQQTSKKIYEHPWNKHMIAWEAERVVQNMLKKPNPPTPEAVEKAKFKD